MTTAVHDTGIQVSYQDKTTDKTLSVFFVLDSTGRIQSLNQAAANLLGYTLTELEGALFAFFVSDRSQPEWFRFLANEQAGAIMEGASVVLELRNKNKTDFPVILSVIRDTPNSKEKHHAFFCIELHVLRSNPQEGYDLDDLTLKYSGEKTQASSTLAKTIAQLEISKNELQKINAFQKALLDNAGAIIISVDIDGVIQTFNPEAEKELGYKALDVIGKYTAELYHDTTFLADKAKELSDALDMELPNGIEILRTGALLSMQGENEWIYVRKNGSRFPVQLSISAMYDKAGYVLGFVEVALDISKTKQIEKELQEALMKEKDLNELKSRFLSMASHEFRTPLSTILSSACLIGKYCSAEDQPKRDIHIRRIMSSVNTLTDILNDFLSIGRIEEGKILVRPSEMLIRDTMNEFIGEMKGTLRKGQHIYYSHEGDPAFTTDISLLKHIVLNLLSNASKFSSEGDAVELHTACTDQRFWLTVTDHGIGISKEDQQHLMERFFRGTNAVHIQGTGLGLHIVAKYAELMGGTVQCISEQGKGTRFTVTLQSLKV